MSKSAATNTLENANIVFLGAVDCEIARFVKEHLLTCGASVESRACTNDDRHSLRDATVITSFIESGAARDNAVRHILESHRRGVLVAAIGRGTLLLNYAGLTTGLRIAVNSGDEQLFREVGADVRESLPAAVHRNILTSPAHILSPGSMPGHLRWLDNSWRFAFEIERYLMTQRKGQLTTIFPNCHECQAVGLFKPDWKKLDGPLAEEFAARGCSAFYMVNVDFQRRAPANMLTGLKKKVRQLGLHSNPQVVGGIVSGATLVYLSTHPGIGLVSKLA